MAVPPQTLRKGGLLLTVLVGVALLPITWALVAAALISGCYVTAQVYLGGIGQKATSRKDGGQITKTLLANGDNAGSYWPFTPFNAADKDIAVATDSAELTDAAQSANAEIKAARTNVIKFKRPNTYREQVKTGSELNGDSAAESAQVIPLERPKYTLQQALDPATAPEVLAQIAAEAPHLRPQVAANPTTYPALLEWLAALKDIDVDLALQRRAINEMRAA